MTDFNHWLDILEVENDEISKRITFFDGETLVSQIDLIENCELFKNIVILQSSLKKLKIKYPFCPKSLLRQQK